MYTTVWHCIFPQSKHVVRFTNSPCRGIRKT